MWTDTLVAAFLMCLVGCGGLAETGNGQTSDGGTGTGLGTTVTCRYQPIPGVDSGTPMGPLCAYSITTFGPLPSNDHMASTCATASMVDYGPGVLSDAPCPSAGLVACCESASLTDGGRFLSGICWYSPWEASRTKETCGAPPMGTTYGGAWSTTLPQ
jgi:hypothetical protein